MGINLQTKVIDKNRDKFYQRAYCQQFNTKADLVDLDMFTNECVLIDCCGWHYRNVFPNKSVTILETIKSAIQFKLDLTKFNKLIDNQTDSHIGWPELSAIDPVLIFDRSPMLKYQSISGLSNMLTNAVEKYGASHLVVNVDTNFVDDDRLQDRFYNLALINITNFTVREFTYNTISNKLFMHFKRNYAA
jgi:hypothetical protein